MTDPVGRHYGSVVRPDPADYDRCPFSDVTKGDDPVVGVFVGWYDTGDYGIRPCYDAVIRWYNGFAYGSDYNPNTGLWQAGEYGLTEKQVESMARRNRAEPLPSHRFSDRPAATVARRIDGHAQTTMEAFP